MLYLLDGSLTLPAVRSPRAGGPAVAGDAGRDATLAVVTIAYPGDRVQRRYFDLTPPTPPEAIPLRKGDPAPRTGGRDAFLRFLEDRVKPAVERRVPIDRDRQALFGHSLAGHFALHVLFTRPQAFRTYVAADPAIWWNGGSILAEMDAFLARPAAARVLILTAGAKASRPGLDAAEIARLEALRSGPTGEAVATALTGAPGLETMFCRYGGETHGSLIPPAVGDALRFAAALGTGPDPANEGAAGD